MRRALVLVAFVTPGMKSSSDLEACRRKRPEMEQYRPMAGEADGGVAWTRAKTATRVREDLDDGRAHPRQ